MELILAFIQRNFVPSKYKKFNYFREILVFPSIGKLWLKNTPLYQKSPKNLLIASAALSTQTGSSTCCILAIDPKSKLLRTSYIGDSGYVIYRKQGPIYEPFYISPEHSRSFNFPYQIGTNGDDPKISLEKTHEVLTGDFIIVATDG